MKKLNELLRDWQEKYVDFGLHADGSEGRKEAQEALFKASDELKPKLRAEPVLQITRRSGEVIQRSNCVLMTSSNVPQDTSLLMWDGTLEKNPRETALVLLSDVTAITIPE